MGDSPREPSGVRATAAVERAAGKILFFRCDTFFDDISNADRFTASMFSVAEGTVSIHYGVLQPIHSFCLVLGITVTTF